MTDHNLFSTDHLTLAATILIPLGSGILYLIWNAAQTKLKVDQLYDMKPMLDLMIVWFRNHGSSVTGYREGDEFKK